MPELFGKSYGKDELSAKTGSMGQVGGVRRVTLAEGSEQGVEAVLFSTGSGLNFTVLPGRGMDISNADWCGQSLCWRSATGDTHSSHFNPDGLGWLQGFYGGLVVTCGMSWAGAASLDPVGVEGGSFQGVNPAGEPEWKSSGALGIHGRASNLPAKHVLADAEWQGEEYVMWAQGKVREASVFGPNFLLERRIWAKLGQNKLWLRDVVRNEDGLPREHMMLYHCNLGFPLVDAGGRYLFPSLKVKPRDEVSVAALDDWGTFPEPKTGALEQVFCHDLATDPAGQTVAGFVNPALKLGLSIRYNKAALPYLNQWKMPAARTYVTGLEPATCHVTGRPGERLAGRLITLQPGEERVYELEFEVLTSQEQLDSLEAEVRGLAG